jgi:hypothetical protein
MILLGDSDGVRLEHAVELFKLLGGGVMGDLQGMPKSQLAVLPGTAHFVPPGHGLLDRADWLLDLIPPFLDEPMPRAADLAGGGLPRSWPGPAGLLRSGALPGAGSSCCARVRVREKLGP